VKDIISNADIDAFIDPAIEQKEQRIVQKQVAINIVMSYMIYICIHRS
jgi:hypothetical protein